MRIVIIGAGVVGTSLAEQLSKESHHVAVIDQNRDRIQDLEASLDVLAIMGDGASPQILARADIEHSDLLLAVTENDEVNLVVGMLARGMGSKRSIIRLRKRWYADPQSPIDLATLGIHRCINPEPAMVESLIQMIDLPGCESIASIADGKLLKLGFDIDPKSPAVGQTVAALRELEAKNAFLILYIRRKDKTLIPRGDDVIEPLDGIHLLVARDKVRTILPLLRQNPPQVRHVVIAGGGRMGLQLAQALEDKIPRLFLLEPDPKLAEQAANQLQQTTILAGAGTQLSVLQEAGIEHCDLFCALTQNDQSNMLMALLAKKNGAKKAAVIVARPEFVPVLDSLGVEIVLNPRLVTVGEILTHVRRGHIHAVTRLAESAAEIIELKAEAGAPAVGRALRDLNFPRHALVGALILDGEVILPQGDTIIQPGSRVVVFALPEAIGRIEKLFATRQNH